MSAPTSPSLDIRIDAGVARVALAREAVHNAFDEALIAELTSGLRGLAADSAVRVVVLSGKGASFCAGADIGWMRRMAHYHYDQNLADAHALAAMLATLANLAKPVVARVHGAAYGGGVGLVACCDVAVGTPRATFALSEVRLGLIPSTVGPYVVRAIGARAAHRYFLTGERFAADEALRLGLLHEVVAEDALDARVDAIVDTLLRSGSAAQAAAKELLRAIARGPIDDALIADTARRIADVRASPEAREGLAAFLDKRPPAWAASLPPPKAR
ncbi:MAG TPA: enoyl-CoA hydratase-related protein [Casimicrobiaceae bacterium]|jgi:methylglutaconyl-CoA hydratase|nr:enoyl-CoA hydratase-related protein [Casimicrobiaceae bacterium]